MADPIDTVDDYMHDGLVEDFDGAPYPDHVQHIIGLFRAEVDRLRTEADVASINAKADDAIIRRLRDLLGKALPWVDPNESDDGHLLTVAITDALGDHRG